MSPLFPGKRTAKFGGFAGAVLVLVAGSVVLQAQQVPEAVLKAEAERVAVVEKVKPSVVAVFGSGGKGGGSGVLISDDGFALTNFHVVAGAGSVMQCGLPDGILYDAVLVGVDKVGDVALIKLYPKKEGQKFPCAVLGRLTKDARGLSHQYRRSPILATDFTPPC